MAKLLKFCLFCGTKLYIVSSTISNDDHAHAVCAKCGHEFRYIDIPDGNFKLVVVEE